MPAKMKKEEKKVKVSGTIKPKQHEWLVEKFGEGRFYNNSHLIQEGIRALQEEEKQKKLSSFSNTP